VLLCSMISHYETKYRYLKIDKHLLEFAGCMKIVYSEENRFYKIKADGLCIDSTTDSVGSEN
jgi:hypothetical protein